jgi:uncharacterized membrane protein
MNERTKKIVGLGLLTAIIVVLQLLAVAIPVGIFTLTLSLVPIVVGAALYGAGAGAWLGFVFSIIVLLTNAGAFLAVNVPGTVITVIAKGTLCGLVAALVYKALANKNQLLAVVLSAIVAPCVNTGLFLLGCQLFFMETISGWASALGYPSAGNYMIFGLVGVNFIIELAINLVLSTTILRIIKLRSKV